MSKKVMRGEKRLLFIWLVVLVSVSVMTIFYGKEADTFQGIADSREVVVSSEESVEIRKILVSEGDIVREGEPLVELANQDLVMKISSITHELDRLKAQKGADRKEIASRITSLSSEKSAISGNINAKIKQLEHQYNFNKELSQGLESLKSSGSATASEKNPTLMEVESLKQELSYALRSKNIEIELLQKMLQTSTDPVKFQVEQLEKELEMLTDKMKKLQILSPLNGIIGSVNFKLGEKVAPFMPIMTLHTKTPTIVKGFVPESRHAIVKTGDKVTVLSFSDKQRGVKGVITGIGSRIVEFPIRLRHHPDFALWGREVMLKISDDNPFILGEKVMISVDGAPNIFEKINSIFNFNEINAEDKKNNIKQIGAEYNLELSGALYLPDIKKYALVSDDTPGKKPLIYLFDGKKIEPVQIAGLEKINDMESIVSDESGNIYIASSSSANKKNNLPEERRLIIKVKRDKESFSLLKKGDLYQILKSSAELAPTTGWGSFVLSGVANLTIDIEGIAVFGRSFFVGFKDPENNGKSMILEIKEIDAAIDAGSVSPAFVSVFAELDLKGGSLSDLYFDGKIFYITSSGPDKNGALWSYDKPANLLKKISNFSGYKPEAVTMEDKNKFFIGFDAKESSYFSTIVLR